MYMGMVLILCGVAVFFGTVTPVLVIPAFVWLIQHNFIKREEASLEQTFGDRFREYKHTVRRWI